MNSKSTKTTIKMVEICSLATELWPMSERYYFENGFRKVHPYYHTFRVYCKERWRDRRMLELFKNEFIGRTEEYYKKAIAEKMILVNGEPVTENTRIRNGQCITHTTHFHEPAILDTEIKIVFKSDDMMIIDKPASMPSHPGGRYRYNSVTQILEAQGYSPLFLVNRLDRPTSGLMVVARSVEKAAELNEKMANRLFKKIYLCKVRGFFPDKAECHEPLGSIDRTSVKTVVLKSGKEASTLFERVLFDGTHSIVKCFPLTGRSHQIRVHLTVLGFPIANDTLYNPDCQEEVRISKTLPTNPSSLCYDCENPLIDQDPDNLVLFLHASEYVIDDVSYTTELPMWAKA